MKKLKAILKDDSAQGMLEYVMLLAVVAAIVLIFKDKIVTQITNLTDGVSNKSNEVLK